MSTEVQPAETKLYTDKSGYFHAGMKQEDLEGKKSIFLNFDEEFARIDTDDDFVLSEDEITEELKRDIESTDKSLYVSSVCGIACAVMGFLSQKMGKTNWWAVAGALANAGFAVNSYISSYKLSERIERGYN